MSSYQYSNNENIKLTRSNQKSISRKLLGSGENTISSQKDIRNSKSQAVSSNKQVERIPLGGKSTNNTNNKPFKKSFKRTSSLLLDDPDKKIKVQKDESHGTKNTFMNKGNSSMSRRKLNIPLVKKISSVSESFLLTPQEEFNYDIEYTPEKIEPLQSVPNDFIPLSDSDIRFFTSKSPIPEKKAIRELNSNLSKMMDFETIPVLKCSDFQNDLKLESKHVYSDSLIKKQPRTLPKCESLADQKIPDLKYIDFSIISTDEFEKDNNDDSYLQSPIKHVNLHKDIRDEDFTDEGLTYDDMESLIM